MAICKLKRGASEEISPADALSSDFQPLEVRENRGLPFKPLNLWFSVMAAWVVLIPKPVRIYRRAYVIWISLFHIIIQCLNTENNGQKTFTGKKSCKTDQIIRCQSHKTVNVCCPRLVTGQGSYGHHLFQFLPQSYEEGLLSPPLRKLRQEDVCGIS